VAATDDWRATGATRRSRSRRATATREAAKRRQSKGSGRSDEDAAAREWLPGGRGGTLRSKAANRRNGRSPKTRRLPVPRSLRGGRGVDGSEERSEALEQRVAELEEKLRAERGKSRRTIAKLRAELKAGPAMPNGKLDANAATFEQLRAVGLSVTQSAKLIARREEQGSFRSKAALSRTPGLSQRARAVIRERLRV